MKRLDGVNTLLMTPYTESNEIDVEGIFRQIDRVLEAGATSVVVQGKIGEYDTYTMDERRDTARAVVEYVNGAALRSASASSTPRSMMGWPSDVSPPNQARTMSCPVLQSTGIPTTTSSASPTSFP